MEVLVLNMSSQREEFAEQARRLEQIRRAQESRLQNGYLPAFPTTESAVGDQQYTVVNEAARGNGQQDRTQKQTAKDPLIYPGVYAPSGFNIMDILVKIHTRPNPQISIGNIDHSVALTLCDYSVPDLPIVYCSEKFESLTRYHSSEILGRNCRFLQHPPPSTGLKVSAKDEKINEIGRKELRQKLERGEEASVQLVNFTKEGERFVNILTTVPIEWEGGKRYVVGFQADAKRVFG